MKGQEQKSVILVSRIYLGRRQRQPTRVLAQRIPWTEEPGGLLSMGSHRVRHDEAPQHAYMHWRKKWQPTPVFLPGESQGQRSLVGCCLWGRTESDTTETTQQQQQDISDKVDVNPHSIKQRQKFFHVKSVYNKDKTTRKTPKQ